MLKAIGTGFNIIFEWIKIIINSPIAPGIGITAIIFLAIELTKKIFRK